MFLSWISYNSWFIKVLELWELHQSISVALWDTESSSKKNSLFVFGCGKICAKISPESIICMTLYQGLGKPRTFSNLAESSVLPKKWESWAVVRMWLMWKLLWFAVFPAAKIVSVLIADLVWFVAGQMPSLYCPWSSVKIQTIHEQYKN